MIASALGLLSGMTLGGVTRGFGHSTEDREGVAVMSDDEHGGYPIGSPFRRHLDDVDPLGASNETPVDLAAVQADDALLDMLGGTEVARGDADAELARVLVAWRRDVDAEPVPELVVPAGESSVLPSARRMFRVGIVHLVLFLSVVAFGAVWFAPEIAHALQLAWSWLAELLVQAGWTLREVLGAKDGE